jgi:hypothetical protein
VAATLLSTAFANRRNISFANTLRQLPGGIRAHWKTVSSHGARKKCS